MQKKVKEKVLKFAQTYQTKTTILSHNKAFLGESNEKQIEVIQWWKHNLPVAHVKCEYIIFSESGFKSTNILRINSLAAMASLWGPIFDEKKIFKVHNETNSIMFSSNSKGFAFYSKFKIDCGW